MLARFKTAAEQGWWGWGWVWGGVESADQRGCKWGTNEAVQVGGQVIYYEWSWEGRGVGWGDFAGLTWSFTHLADALSSVWCTRHTGLCPGPPPIKRQQILLQTLYNINVCQQVKNASRSCGENEPLEWHSWAPSNQYVVIWLRVRGWAHIHSIPTLGIGSAGISPTATAVRPDLSQLQGPCGWSISDRLQQTRLITLNSKIQPRSV